MPLSYGYCQYRTVGVRLGAGESLHDIMSSSRQVAEGVSTAGQPTWFCVMQTALRMGVLSVVAVSGRKWNDILFQPVAD